MAILAGTAEGTAKEKDARSSLSPRTPTVETVAEAMCRQTYKVTERLRGPSDYAGPSCTRNGDMSGEDVAAIDLSASTCADRGARESTVLKARRWYRRDVIAKPCEHRLTRYKEILQLTCRDAVSDTANSSLGRRCESDSSKLLCCK